MIDDIKKLIDAHKQVLPDFTGSIVVSVFHHGRAYDWSKVLMLVTADSKQVALLKLARSKEYNKRIREEYEALLVAGKQSIFRVPSGYFIDEIHGYALSAEEVIEGEVISATAAVQLLPDVERFVSSTPKLREVRPQDIVHILEKKQGASVVYDVALEAARACGVGITVHGALTHGDVTYRNIILSAEGPFLIDWADANTRPLWGVDLAHFVRRLPAAKQEQLLMPVKEFQFLVAVDECLDCIKKENISLYADAVRELRELCLLA